MAILSRAKWQLSSGCRRQQRQGAPYQGPIHSALPQLYQQHGAWERLLNYQLIAHMWSSYCWKPLLSKLHDGCLIWGPLHVSEKKEKWDIWEASCMSKSTTSQGLPQRLTQSQEVSSQGKPWCFCLKEGLGPEYRWRNWWGQVGRRKVMVHVRQPEPWAECAVWLQRETDKEFPSPPWNSSAQV